MFTPIGFFAESGPSFTTDGLRMSVDASLASSYPGSGTTWFDTSGNGFDFTLANSPTYSSANKTFTFGSPTVHQVARYNPGTSFDITNASTDYNNFGITFEFIVRPIGKGRFFSRWGTNDLWNFTQDPDVDDVLVAFRNSANQGNFDITNNVLSTSTLQQWITTMERSAGGTIFFTHYVNNVQVGSDTWTNAGNLKMPSTKEALIGPSAASSVQKSEIGAVRVYEKVLSSDERLVNYTYAQDTWGI